MGSQRPTSHGAASDSTGYAPLALAGWTADEGLGKSRVTKTDVPTPTIRLHPSKDHTRRRFLAATIRRKQEPAKRCWGPRAEQPAVGDLDRRRENQKKREGKGGGQWQGQLHSLEATQGDKKKKALDSITPYFATSSRPSPGFRSGPSLALEGAARAFNGRPCAYGMAWHGMAWHGGNVTSTASSALCHNTTRLYVCTRTCYSQRCSGVRPDLGWHRVAQQASSPGRLNTETTSSCCRFGVEA